MGPHTRAGLGSGLWALGKHLRCELCSGFGLIFSDKRNGFSGFLFSLTHAVGLVDVGLCRACFPLPMRGASASSAFDVPLAIVITETNSVENDNCGICLETLESGVNICVLPVCKHLFHIKCTHKWFENRKYCPLCNHYNLRRNLV
ncbi:hypothetical protein RND81_04G069300 [Saponaria officinalis]|uniref:RING-type domain-containing protein n=1 Tax=Saponaria officinalis TaxID=3572 RepID=A0AAW1LI64_SAPOF